MSTTAIASEVLGAAEGFPWVLAFAFVVVVTAIAVLVFLKPGISALWLQAFMGNARVSLMDLIGMRLRRIDARSVVLGMIHAKRAGLSIRTQDLETRPAVRDMLAAIHRGELTVNVESDAAGNVVMTVRDPRGKGWEATAESQGAALAALAEQLGRGDHA